MCAGRLCRRRAVSERRGVLAAVPFPRIVNNWKVRNITHGRTEV